ncbi:MAG: hypothetical protein VB035_00660 [Candidatus Fimivivens sp.]|nr:hypothetical protein [Candidatus Fimivivens sp.]
MSKPRKPLPDVVCCHCGGIIREADRPDAYSSKTKSRPAKTLWIHKTCYQEELKQWKQP